MRATVLFVPLAVVVAASCAIAEQPLMLRYQFPPGHTLHYETTAQLQGHSIIPSKPEGEREKLTLEGTLVLRTLIENVATDDTKRSRVRVRVGHVAWEGTVGGRKIRFNFPSPSPKVQPSQLSMILPLIVPETMVLSLSTRGVVLGSTGSALNLMPSFGPMNFFAVEPWLPATGVLVGDEWGHKVGGDVSVGDQKRFEVRTMTTFDAVEGGDGLEIARMTRRTSTEVLGVSLRPVVAEQIPGSLLRLEVPEFSGSDETEVRFDLSNGRVQSEEGHGKAIVQLVRRDLDLASNPRTRRVKVEMKVEWKTELKKVDVKPSS